MPPEALNTLFDVQCRVMEFMVVATYTTLHPGHELHYPVLGIEEVLGASGAL